MPAVTGQCQSRTTDIMHRGHACNRRRLRTAIVMGRQPAAARHRSPSRGSPPAFSARARPHARGRRGLRPAKQLQLLVAAVGLLAGGGPFSDCSAQEASCPAGASPCGPFNPATTQCSAFVTSGCCCAAQQGPPAPAPPAACPFGAQQCGAVDTFTPRCSATTTFGCCCDGAAGTPPPPPPCSAGTCQNGGGLHHDQRVWSNTNTMQLPGRLFRRGLRGPGRPPPRRAPRRRRQQSTLI
eukprot:SAG22_NODE_2796_length_2203_cov_7.370247_2_plen_239_part_00